MSLISRINSYLRWVLYLLFLVFCKTSFAVPFNMTPGVTLISHRIYDLHMTIFCICVAIGVGVFSVMIYSLIFHRKSVGHKAAGFHEHTWLEITWAIIPLIILIIMSVPATKLLMQMDDESKADVTIKITGYQWKWRYEYLDQGISYFSNLSTPADQLQNQAPKDQWYLLEVDKPLVLPINKKIRFLVTSNDVIHSWWVPELGIKRDAIPGFMYEAWATIQEPGTYRGQCAELCGINHGFMPIVVQAVSQEDFDKWVSEQSKTEDKSAKVETTPAAQKTMTREQLMTLGKQKYEQICSACHKPDGTGLPPLYPALKGSSVAVGAPISRHIALVLNGIPGSAMQPYKDQLTDEEIAAIITYERNAWENNTDDEIQPADVAAERQKANQQPTLVNKVRAGGLQ